MIKTRKSILKVSEISDSDLRFVVLTLLVLLMSCGGNDSPSGPPAPGSLAVSSSNLEFGDASEEITITLTNNGDETLTWAASASDPWILLPEAAGMLRAAASRDFIVRVDRQGLADGEHQGSVVLEYVTGQITILVSATKRRVAEIDVSFEDGFIVDGVFQAAKDAFSVGEGGPFRNQDLVHQFIFTNRGPIQLDDVEVRVTEGQTGAVEFEGVRPGFPTRGTVTNASRTGFLWRVGDVPALESAEIQFYSEAMAAGHDVVEADFSASGSLLGSVGEPIAIERTRALAFSVQDGRIDTGGIFNSSATFTLGDGGIGRENELYYQLILTNSSAATITGIRVEASTGDRGVLALREIRSGFPLRGTISSIAPEGFVWSMGAVGPGESSELQARVEAVRPEYGEFRVRVTTDQASGVETMEVTGVSN